MSTPIIDFHPSTLEETLREEAIESLRANRIDPKFLYITPHQTELWRQVFLKHSPIHGNPEFTRIYREAYAQVALQFQNRNIALIGLGCGTGLKERDLYSILQASHCDVRFSAIDVSHNLVLESVQKLTKAGASHRRSLVSDLTQTDFLKSWLDRFENDLPRVMTFFGLAPNFIPSVMAHLLRAALRPGDVLLASAHLAPARNENREEIAAAMNSILPQYHNRETFAWLSAALQHWDLEDLVETPEIKVREMEGVPAFLASTRWKSSLPFERWGHRFSPKTEDPLRLFFSLRYTLALFEEVLRREGFVFELLSLTSCRQEAIWCIRRA